MKLFKLCAVISLFLFSFTVQSNNVFIGDSITAAFPSQNLFPGIAIINQGISGNTSANILQRMDTILATKPSKAFLMFGINDFGTGATADQVFANYQQIVDRLLEKKAEIVISSTIKCSPNIIYLHSEFINSKVDQLNEKLKSYSKLKRLTYIDVNKNLSDSQGLESRYTVDGIHLNLEGYKVWSSLLRPMMNKK